MEDRLIDSCDAPSKVSVKRKDKYWLFGSNVRLELPDPLTCLFMKTEFTDTCWLFHGRKSRGGYGLVKVNGKNHHAHRYLYELFNGKIDRDLVCCHKCDVRNCINIHHIFIGTRAENQKDMKDKGRAAIGTRNGMAKLDPEKIEEIFKLRSQGMMQKDIGKIFNITQSHVSLILRGVTWTSLKKDPAPKMRIR